MSTQANDTVIEKLSKILNLANGLNATPGEMEAAMAMAKKIALQHNIDLAGIQLNKDNGKGGPSIEIEKHTLKIRSKHEQKYHRRIYWVLQSCFGIRIIRTSSGVVYFVGETVDVTICTQLFPWLEQVFYQTYWKAKKAGVVVSCAADKNGIYEGLALGIIEVNRREEAKLSTAEKACTALVLVKKDDLIKRRVEQEFPHLTSRRASTTTCNYSAREHGRQEGRKIRLNQTGAGTSAKQIQ